MNDLLEFKYLEEYLQYRLDIYFNENSNVPEPDVPPYSEWFLQVPEIILKASLNKEEKTLLLLALCPQVEGNLLDRVFQDKLSSTGDFPQLGGVRGRHFRGFMPTGETALFLLAGRNFEKRLEVYKYLGSDHFFGRHHIIWLEDAPDGEPVMSGKLMISPEYVELFLLGRIGKPSFSLKFPAQLVETEMEWEDLILNAETSTQIQELQAWITHGNTLLYDWGMHKKIKPGYRVLFHGPSGTGKTLTASLLGKYTGKDVYRIDLSMVVSKFIGETEKNLANLLATAEKTEGILFFDEADALFGKRTNVRDAHDKYANQEVSYLLQRIENYAGLVILASNLKSNIDDAFLRRFQAIIHFPFPSFSERFEIWKKAFPKKIKLNKEIELAQIARKYELAGAEIMNIAQYACLRTLSDNKKSIQVEYIIDGIQREYQKGGKIMR